MDGMVNKFSICFVVTCMFAYNTSLHPPYSLEIRICKILFQPIFAACTTSALKI